MMSHLPISEYFAHWLAEEEFYADAAQHRRLYESIKKSILQGQLPADTQLPSSRKLAQDLNVSRNTVISAYEQLIEEGWLYSVSGSGTFVSAISGSVISSSASLDPAIEQDVYKGNSLSQRGKKLGLSCAGVSQEIQPFAPGPDDFSMFPLKIWQKLHNQIWKSFDSRWLDYAYSGGYEPLRMALAEYLRVSRGVHVVPEQILVTAGTQQSLFLCAQLLADPKDTVIVENPLYWGARYALEAYDLQLYPAPIDEEGIVLPSRIRTKTKPKLIYVTPCRQFPLGTVMSPARRAEVLAFAQKQGAWVLEDDYDSEFRYHSAPVPALQSEDRWGQVIYMGTFSKVLYPGIKMGYLVVPLGVAEAFKNALYDLYRPGQLILQAVLSAFFQQGYFTNHIRQVRQMLGENRQLLVHTLQQYLPSEVLQQIQIGKEASGLHLVIHLPAHVSDEEVVRVAQEQELSLKPLSRYYIRPPIEQGILVGYAYVAKEKIRLNGVLLARVIKQVFSHQ